MKPGIIMALATSLALVGWASWYRIVSRPAAALLVSVPHQDVPQAYYDDLIQKYAGTSSSSPAEREDLTTTDLVSRQLISDYLALAQNGQATDANLTDLATRYAASIPTIITTKKIAPIDLHIVSNSQANYEAYSSQMTDIYNSYSSAILSVAPKSKLAASPADVPWDKLEKAYAQTADRLKELSVPASIADDHASLVNLYVEDAAACHALSLSSSDPASSFAGLILWNSNAEKEKELTSEMQNIVSQYGV